MRRKETRISERTGIPQTVAREFNQADKGKKLAEAMKRMPKRDAD